MGIVVLAFLVPGVMAVALGVDLLTVPGLAPIGGAFLIALGIALCCVAVSAIYAPDSHGKCPLPSSQCDHTRNDAGGRE